MGGPSRRGVRGPRPVGAGGTPQERESQALSDPRQPIQGPLVEPLPEEIREEQLPSGVRVVTERMPEVRSVALGCWVTVGARDEPDELSGASHFLEHLLFKGTAERSAREIAEQVDSIGGEMNAFTAKEHTAYFLRLPDHALAWGVELLGDVLARPALRPKEMDAERLVILEELAMSMDDPDDRVQTLLFERLFPGHPIGREVLGDRGTIGAMGTAELRGFHGRYYGARNLVVSAAGLLDHGELVELVDRAIPPTPGGKQAEREAPRRDAEPLVVEHRPIEQVHLSIGWRGLDLDDPDRYALAVVNNVLGGGPSSRLFQEVREERGLAYTVYSAPASFTDCGALTVNFATGPDRLAAAMEVVDGIVASLLRDGLTDREVEVATGYLVGSLLLGLEDSGSRMARLGYGKALRNSVITIDEHVRRLEAVSGDDIRRVLERVFGGPRSVAAVGPVDESHPALAAVA